MKIINIIANIEEGDKNFIAHIECFLTPEELHDLYNHHYKPNKFFDKKQEAKIIYEDLEL